MPPKITASGNAPAGKASRGRARRVDLKKGATLFGLAFVILLWRAPELDRFLANPDQGFQISLGQQVLLGRFPFVDLAFVYGPLVAFTSALGIGVSGNLLGEILICSFFYSLCLLLLHLLVRRWISPVASWIVPLLGFLLLARFHKWYVWFFPLAVLYCFSRQLDDSDSSLRWWMWGGLVSGVGALYRLDYGVALLLFLTVLAWSPRLTNCSDGRFWLQRWGASVASFLAPLLLWLGILGLNGGAKSIQLYFVATLRGGAGTVADLSLPFPQFSFSVPFGLESARFLALFLMPITYLVCISVGSWRGYLRPHGAAREARFLAALGLLGLAVYPQGTYRPDPSHFYQIVPPMLLAATAILHRGRRLFLGGGSNNAMKRRKSLQAAVVIYATLLAATVSLLSNPPSDLAPIGSNPIARYRELRFELGAVEGSPLIQAQIASLVVSETRPEDPILVISYAPQIYYFSRRPMSGLLNAYFFGVLDGPEMRLLNLEHIRLHPPALVVAPRSLSQMSPDSEFRRAQPELHDFLVDHYKNVVYGRGRWAVFAPSED
jgi:hypothetical protein